MDSKKKIKQANKKIRKFGVDVAVFEIHFLCLNLKKEPDMKKNTVINTSCCNKKGIFRIIIIIIMVIIIMMASLEISITEFDYLPKYW